MRKALGTLLGKEEAEIAAIISKFESITGYPSHDVRLLAENKQKIRTKIAELGLDGDDTTDEELYHALRSRYHQDAQAVDKALGADGYLTLDQKIAKAVQLVDHTAAGEELWLVKNSTAKQALKENSPKRVAKIMHYRSTSSLIKRADIAEVFLLASQLEPASWHSKIDKRLSKLNVARLQQRRVRIIKLSTNHLKNIKGPAAHIVADKWLGSIGLWPDESLEDAPVLSLALLLLGGLETLDPSAYKTALHELNPTLMWWADCSYLLTDGEHPMSFNPKDVALNHLKNHDVRDAVSRHGGQSLWRELVDRYRQISESVEDVAEQPTEMPLSKELAAELATVE